MKKTKCHALFAASIAIALVISGELQAEDVAKRSIVNTAHNLSVTGGSGPGRVASTSEERICIFCHTPHHSTADGPLWSRGISDESTPYTFYWSKTLKAASPLRPGGASRLCLSCHDGTIALGKLTMGVWIDPGLPALSPTYKSNLGVNLSRNHPISIEYGLKPNEFQSELTRSLKNIKLAENTFVECTSCHDPHNDQFGQFLVADSSIQRDALCTGCHKPAGWDDPIYESVHRTGGTRFPAGSTSVAQSGCTS